MRTKLTNGSKARFAIFTGIVAIGILLTHGQGQSESDIDLLIDKSYPYFPWYHGQCYDIHDQLEQDEIRRHNERNDKLARSRSWQLDRSQRIYVSFWRLYSDIADAERDAAGQVAAIAFAAAQAALIRCLAPLNIPLVRAALCYTLYKTTMIAIGVELRRKIEAIETRFEERHDLIKYERDERNEEINQFYDERVEREQENHKQRMGRIRSGLQECLEREGI